jgi:hypothetical protein
MMACFNIFVILKLERDKEVLFVCSLVVKADMHLLPVKIANQGLVESLNLIEGAYIFNELL